MSENPTQSKEYINTRLSLPCDKKCDACGEPYYELHNEGDDKMVIRKICQEHGDIIATAIEINPFRSIHLSGFKFRVESVKRHGEGDI